MKKAIWLSHSSKFVLVFALIVPSIELSTAPAFAQGVQFWNKNCKKEYKKWESTSKHKAFATSNPNTGSADGQACGFSWNYPTKAGAESAAVASCKKERRGACWVIKSE